MKKKIFLILCIFITSASSATNKDYITKNFQNVENISFKFEQNINGKIENGFCTIEYPKKIFCKYDLENKKVLVSNGKSIVIKTLSSYYIYPIEKTPQNYILDKKFLLRKINESNEKIIGEKFINYSFSQNENKINVFFDKKTHNLIGWQIIDIYQNLSITYLNSIIKNNKLDKNLFNLPAQN